MSKFYFDLNLDIEPLKSSVTLDFLQDTFVGNQPYGEVPHVILNPDLLTFFRQRHLTVSQMLFFYKPKNTFGTVHVDDFNHGTASINFVWGGASSIMNWYSINNGVSIENKPTLIIGEYATFKNDEVTLIDSHHIRKVAVVEVSTPHNVTTLEEGRYCLCVRLIKNNELLTMDQAEQIFNDCKI